MQIMTVLGSPRRQGNTAKVLGWIEEHFQADGHEVESAGGSVSAFLGGRVSGPRGIHRNPSDVLADPITKTYTR